MGLCGMLEIWWAIVGNLFGGCVGLHGDRLGIHVGIGWIVWGLIGRLYGIHVGTVRPLFICCGILLEHIF